MTRKFVLGLTIIILILLSPSVPAQIRGTLSNFDAHNDHQQPMTNLELDLRNIYPWQIMSYYQGPNAWGIPPIVDDVSGTEVTWADFRNPFLPGQTWHFGLELTPGAPFPCGAQAYWTQHLKVVEIPVPWQTWRPEPDAIVDAIALNPDFAEPVIIRREFSDMPSRVPLDQLNWNNPAILWRPVPLDPVVLSPGGRVELTIPLGGGGGGGAVYVRYTVALASNPDNILTRFVNEAEYEYLPALQQIPSIVGELSNFDAHNDTGKPVHDLELDILNIVPADIIGWYNGPDAWGLHPVTQDPVIRAIAGGTEANWIDEWNPIDYSQRRHFGLRLRPGTPEPLVRAFWTRIVKVKQLPVPWQWWQIPSTNVIRDVVQLSDTFDGPVWIRREWAVLPGTVLLDNLTWDIPVPFWQSVDEIEILMQPGDQVSLDIPLLAMPPGPATVLVRYTAREDIPGPGTATVVRFINAALLPGGPALQIVGSLSNFDVTNATNTTFTNLELDLRSIKPVHIVNWYGGAMAWGLHPVTHAPIIRDLPQTEVTWAAFRDPLPYCQTRHFGIRLAGAPVPCGVQAYWTQHRKVVEIPVPWQTWRPAPGLIVDVIRLSPAFPVGVLLRREFAVLPVRLPLDELNWDNPAIPWQPVMLDPVVLSPGDTVELPIPVTGPMSGGGVYVRYTVALASDPDNILTRFVNEAEFDLPPITPIPSIVGTLSNFDAHNDTGKPAHDLELDIQNITPDDVWDWYRGPGAWGLDPVVSALPDGGGTEVTWVDDGNPMDFCQTRHFGLRLDPNTPEPLVRAFWTRHVKVAQIPVPWQFWLAPGGPFIRDVVQLSDTFTEPVLIRRDFAVVNSVVPLDDLNWGLVATWETGDPNPVLLQPGFQAGLDIPVDRTTDAAVLVRYEVTLASTGTLVTRFVNEAILECPVKNLRFMDNETFTWDTCPGGAPYDIVHGSLSSLRLNGGCQGATCLANDHPGPPYTSDLIPPLGDGYYYLVRYDNDTYDSTFDPTSREGRDEEVRSGGGDCP